MHGFNLGAEKWEQVVWGVEPHSLGRVPKAGTSWTHTRTRIKHSLHTSVLVALQQNASMLAFGTGVKVGENGVECDRMHAVFAERIDRLRNFEALAHYERAQFEALKANVFLDRVSQNTVNELREIGGECVRRRIERLFLVSSPTHVSRCLRDALVVIDEEQQRAAERADASTAALWRRLAQNLFATPSDVSYANAAPAQVVIFEPPHRPDSPLPSLHALAARMQRIARDRLADFAFDLSQLLNKFGR